MKRLNFALIIIILCVLSAGCGYTTRSALPGNLRTIYIAPFANNIPYTTDRAQEIYFPLLEVKVRNAIEERFLFDGQLRIAKEMEADLVLRGELIGYERSALRYTDNDDVQEYRVQIVVNLVLEGRTAEEPVWEEKGFVGEATYFVIGPTSTSESAAVEDATTDLARRVVERTIENW